MSVTELRAADADRDRVVDRLWRAQRQGRIDVFEFDERLAAAYAARTYGELAKLTGDLPAEDADSADGQAGPATDGRSDAGRSGGGRRSQGYAVALRMEGAAWLFASVLNLAIWAIVSVAGASAVYPWWIWVAGPWGAVLMARRLEQGLRKRASTRF